MSCFKKSFYYLILVIVLIFSISIEASAKNAINEIPILLKIGKYDILYTYPREPFITNNRLMISVKSIQDLMGGEIKYDNVSKKTTINWFGHEFKYAFNSYDATVDNNLIKMDSKTTVIQNRLYIPIYILLNNTDIKWCWSTKQNKVQISDTRALKGTPFHDFESNDLVSGVINENAFNLISYSLTPYKEMWENLSIKALNISDHDIPFGKADIQPLVSYLDKGGYAVDSYIRQSAPLLPMIKKGEIIVKTREFDFKNYKAAYIICVGRELQ